MSGTFSTTSTFPPPLRTPEPATLALFGAGLAGLRAMITGLGGLGNTLSYALFQPTVIGGLATSSGTPWGDGLVGGNPFTVPVSTGVAARTVLVFGSIPGGQDVSTGAYVDNVTATVNF